MVGVRRNWKYGRQTFNVPWYDRTPAPGGQRLGGRGRTALPRGPARPGSTLPAGRLLCAFAAHTPQRQTLSASAIRLHFALGLAHLRSLCSVSAALCSVAVTQTPCLCPASACSAAGSRLSTFLEPLRASGICSTPSKEGNGKPTRTPWGLRGGKARLGSEGSGAVEDEGALRRA